MEGDLRAIHHRQRPRRALHGPLLHGRPANQEFGTFAKRSESENFAQNQQIRAQSGSVRNAGGDRGASRPDGQRIAFVIAAIQFSSRESLGKRVEGAAPQLSRCSQTLPQSRRRRRGHHEASETDQNEFRFAGVEEYLVGNGLSGVARIHPKQAAEPSEGAEAELVSNALSLAAGEQERPRLGRPGVRLSRQETGQIDGTEDGPEGQALQRHHSAQQQALSKSKSRRQRQLATKRQSRGKGRCQQAIHSLHLLQSSRQCQVDVMRGIDS